MMLAVWELSDRSTKTDLFSIKFHDYCMMRFNSKFMGSSFCFSGMISISFSG